LEEYRHVDANEIVAAFAANPLFRSAQADELINEDDSLGRPVRPHDLPMLDFRDVLPRERYLTLSALLGHRMLTNAYEAEYLLIPNPGTPVAWSSFRDFFSSQNTMLSGFVRPILEHHLFGALEISELDRDLVLDLDDVRAAVAELEAHVRDRAEQTSATIRSLRDPRTAVLFLLAQMTCGWQARVSAVRRGVLGDHAGAAWDPSAAIDGFVDELVLAAAQLGELLDLAGLSRRRRAYWQFYLSSSLARTNNLYRLAREHGRFFELMGALVHEQINIHAFAEVLQPTITAHFDGSIGGDAKSTTSLLSSLVAPMVEQYGNEIVVGPVLAGLEVADELHALAHDDLRRQMVWADDLTPSSAEAARLQALIDRGELVVDLDTFVESSEETSTTHVHDEHRLVVIESGKMVFWNNIGAEIELSTGEMLLVPRTRLHGSVVMSGKCTYHQPIIPEELLLLNFD
jgi:hypothetical protein